MYWLFALALGTCPTPAAMTVEADRDHVIADLPVTLTITALGEDEDGELVPLPTFCGPALVTGASREVDGELVPVTETPPFSEGKTTLEKITITGDAVVVSAGTVAASFSRADRASLRQLPGVLSILPPLFAILLAVILRQALLALFAGIWLGACFLHGYDPFTALFRTFDTYLPRTLVDPGHAAIVVFTMALGGMVGIVSHAGGTKALVDVIARRASSRRAGMLTAWASGLVVFFDDYANCLLVGNTVRPFTDRLRISREKLAYIVDSTAAPISTIALVSTWIGYQISQLDDALAGKEGVTGGYDLFLNMLPYSFYSFFTLAFVFYLAISRRDFGPMAIAERRAIHEGQLLRPGAQPLMDKELADLANKSHERAHWITAVLPILTVILVVFGGLYVSGASALAGENGEPGIREIIAAADSYAVLLWASFGGSLVALITAVATRSAGLGESLEAWIAGCKAMVIAVLILVLAWGLGDMCKEHLRTGEWILSQIAPSPHLLPLLTFVIAGLIALATGSSFSTMAIVIPIVGPMAWVLTGDDAGLSTATVDSIRFATLAAVLSGAVFGDHCSPISDTTIMSSMSSAADHVDHIRTQAPYAVVCALVAGLIGFLPAGWGISPWITLPAGLAILAGVVWGVGKRAADDP